MQAGLLTEGFKAERVATMPKDDWRSRAEEFKEPSLSRNLALRDALRPIASRHGVSVAALAVAWTLIWPGVTGAIVGGRSPRQVDDWNHAGELGLGPEAIAEIAAELEKIGVGAGPVSPEP
jgi:aryl-alcohol dehydrogenase-like predicted oxidoreductase